MAGKGGNGAAWRGEARRDPRAQSMRRSGQPGPAASSSGRGPTGPVSASNFFGNGNGVGTTPSGAQGMQGMPSMPSGPDGIFTPLSRQIGIEGREFLIPSILGMPEQRFPQIVALIAVVLAVVAGWHVGLGFFGLYLVIKSNQAHQQAQDQQQQQQQQQPRRP